MEEDNQKKRRPGSEQTRSSSQNVQRRSSKKSSSQDRHGKVFRDPPRERTIRAVTPESHVSSVVSTPGIDTDIASPAPQSPRSRLPYTRRDKSASVSNTDEESAFETQRRKGKMKSKRRGTATSEASPNSFITKTRHRLEQVASTASMPLRLNENVGSIGFPSVIQSPSLMDPIESHQEAFKASRRTFSSETRSNGRQGMLRSPLLFNTDSKKILHLMKTTCGRMHGILFFRPTNSDPWASGYCAINVAPGSLVCQSKGDIATTRTLIPDLRGCSVRTHYDAETQSTYLGVLTASSGLGFQLRPPVPETFDSWLAALLCWQPLPPKGLHNKMAKPDVVSTLESWKTGYGHDSDITSPTDTSAVKSGKAHLWDASFPLPSPVTRQDARLGARLKSPRGAFSSWRRVSCTLFEDGNLSLLTEPESRPVASIQLKHLSRSAIQPLHISVLDQGFCLAFFTQYTSSPDFRVVSQPLFISLDTQSSFEEWLVLLRAYAMPELYGPEQSMSTVSQVGQDEVEHQHTELSGRMFRLERTLSVRVTELRLQGDNRGEHGHDQTSSVNMIPQDDYYAELLLDRDLRARTTNKVGTTSIFWAEEFHFDYLAPYLIKLSVLIKVGNPAEREWTMIAHGPYDLAHGDNSLAIAGKIEVLSHDTVYGRVDIPLDELESRRDIDKRWPVLDKNGRVVGDLLMKVNLQETVVLMQGRYKALSDLLHNFSNSLTPQIANVLGSELKQLSEVLLDIYQVSGHATEWLNNLVEEEIDGIYKEGPPSRLRFTGRVYSSDSYETGEHREQFVRDMSRSANNEANLLFRGNSLATKALDAHMRRLGRDYLSETLGSVLRGIVGRDLDCEVDPVRLRHVEHLDRNWKSLISVTTSVWNAIAESGRKCPAELCGLFKHIRSCAEDRYGSFIRTVKYTSVSGFLFLRLFCPAILNPELFGLLRDRPPERARRTLTLIAKSLIVLANMTRFGTKEPWMEPMNVFLMSATPGFRILIEQVTSVDRTDVPTVESITPISPSVQVLNRLPSVAREGSPSLPFLLDSSKSMATLVNLWIDRAPANIAENRVDDCVRNFHELCTDIHKRSSECLNNAEQAPRPDGNLEPKWQKLLAERQADMAVTNPFEDQFSSAAHEDEKHVPTQQPKRPSNGHTSRHPSEKAIPSQSAFEDITPTESTSTGRNQRNLYHSQGNTIDTGGFITSSTNSSSLSLEAVDEVRPRRPPSSRDSTTKSRLFDLVSLPTRRKGKQPGRQREDEDEQNEI